MHLTPLGANVAQRGVAQRIPVAVGLLQAVGNLPIANYVNGICYDAVAFVRYLLGAAITPQQLVNIAGQGWAQLFNAAGALWLGAPIPPGTAVLFRRPGGAPFHAAVALGPPAARTVRGINGGRLGAGWTAAGDSNLTIGAGVLMPYPQNQNIVFKYGAAQGDICEVWLSNL